MTVLPQGCALLAIPARAESLILTVAPRKCRSTILCKPLSDIIHTQLLIWTNEMKNKPNHEHGAIFYEFAISLPLLFFLMSGIFELGHFMNSHITASRVSYEGARFAAALPGLTDEQHTTDPLHYSVFTRMQELYTRYGYHDSAVTVEINIDSVASQNHVVVSTKIQYSPIFYSVLDLTEIESTVRLVHLYQN